MSKVDTFKAELLARDPLVVAGEWLFDSLPVVFEDSMSDYIEWKTKLADGLEVDVNNLRIVGSAGIGFSLNPNKDWKEFHEESDIDVAIISPYHFEESWRFMRRLGPKIFGMPHEARISIRAHVEKYIYWGTIATDQFLQYLPFGRSWSLALANAGKHPLIGGREVNARVYRDYDALTGYTVNRLRNVIQNELKPPS